MKQQNEALDLLEELLSVTKITMKANSEYSEEEKEDWVQWQRIFAKTEDLRLNNAK